MVNVQFIGSGDAFGTGGRLQACIQLEGETGRVLLDCGTTSLVGLKRAGIDPSSIDVVVVSHLHGDHFGGLPFLFLDGQFSRRTRPLTIIGAAGTRDRLASAMAILYPGSEQVAQKYAIEHLELRNGESVSAGAVSVEAFPADRAAGAESHTIRAAFDSQRIAYTGDTAWNAAVPAGAADADLFIAEAYTAGKQVRHHLSYDDWLVDGRLKMARQTIVTHMGASVLDLPETVVPRAHDGLIVEL